MQHHLKVSATEFEALQGKKRHIIVKPADYQISDTLVVTYEGTREQLTFSIIGTEPLHQRSMILTLFAPYITLQDLPDTVG